MTKRAVTAAIVLLIACGHSQQKPLKLSAVDQEVLKRTEAQLQSLQLRYQYEAAPIIKEHEEIVTHYCQLAGLISGQGGNCQVDSQSGLVSKTASPGPPVPLTPAPTPTTVPKK